MYSTDFYNHIDSNAIGCILSHNQNTLFLQALGVYPTL